MSGLKVETTWVRKSLGTRLDEALRGRGMDYTVVTTNLGGIGYLITGDGPSYTPGELAAKLGIPIVDDHSWACDHEDALAH